MILVSRAKCAKTKKAVNFGGGRNVILSNDRIAANCISPKIVESELTKTYWGSEKGGKARAESPTRRFARPAEVAEATRYLPGDAAAMVNGANLMLDGGNTIRRDRRHPRCLCLAGLAGGLNPCMVAYNMRRRRKAASDFR